MEATRYSEMSVLTRATHHIPEDGILHSNRRENLRSYSVCYVCVLLYCDVFDQRQRSYPGYGCAILRTTGFMDTLASNKSGKVECFYWDSPIL
jgi:hypothetical protein